MIGTNITTIHGNLAMWDPLRECSDAAFRLWVVLYSSARRVIPALWSGGILTFADAAKFTVQKTIETLDELLSADLVEYDDKREVLRLTKLPDRSMRPHNGRHVRALWNKFVSVVACDVRNAHVRTLGWLLADPEHPMTADHATAWEETFGTITLPSARRRGAKRILDEDTSTPTQPSLFATKPPTTVSHPHQSDTVSDTHIIRIRDQDQDLLPDLESKSDATSPVDEFALPLMVPVPAMDDLPWSIEQMLSTIAQDARGRFASSPFDARLTEALCATVRACERSGVELGDLVLAGGWIGAGGLAYRTDLGPAWCAKPGNLLDAVAHARTWASQGKPDLSRARASPGRRVDPAPLGAHGNGKRRL